MAHRKKYKLEKSSTSCEKVVLPTTTKWGNPIGTVCKVDGGYTYREFPVLTVSRGPAKTKAAAVAHVISSYKRWIG